AVVGLAVTSTGVRLVSAGDRTVIQWDVSTGNPATVHKLDSDSTAVAFAPDARSILCGTANGKVYLFDENAKQIPLRPVIPGEIRCLACSPDNTKALAGGVGGTLKMWDLKTRAESASLNVESAIFHRAVFTPDGKRVVYLLQKQADPI